MWTEERIEKLRTLWNEGHSASQCARVLGGGLSRSAIIGKVHRIGLPGRKVKVRRPSKDHWNTEDRRMERGDKPFKQAVKPKPNWRAEPLPKVPASDVARVKFADLGPDDCRWPVGDPKQPGFGFCGCKKVEGLSYCAPHAHRAYATPDPNQRAKPFLGRVARVMAAESLRHANAKEFADT